jgi:hypothetical protein
MPGIAGIVAPGYPYHVTQRGNYQQPIFDEEGAFRQYLQWLKQYEQIIKNIKKCSMAERPCGDDSFINKLEKLFGRRLRALLWGLPRKTEKTIK